MQLTDRIFSKNVFIVIVSCSVTYIFLTVFVYGWQVPAAAPLASPATAPSSAGAGAEPSLPASGCDCKQQQKKAEESAAASAAIAAPAAADGAGSRSTDSVSLLRMLRKGLPASGSVAFSQVPVSGTDSLQPVISTAAPHPLMGILARRPKEGQLVLPSTCPYQVDLAPKQHLHEYATFHRQRRLDTNSRYLLYRCRMDHISCGGVGGFMKGVVGIAFYSILFDRVFFIDAVKPAPLQNVLQPNMIDWFIADDTSPMKHQTKQDFNMVNSLELRRVMMSGSEQEVADFFQGGSSIAAVNDDMVSLLVSNPNLRQRIRQKLMLADAQTALSPCAVYSLMYSFLFKIDPAFRDWPTVLKDLLPKFESFDMVVGAQLRLGGTRAAWLDAKRYPSDKLSHFFVVVEEAYAALVRRFPGKRIGVFFTTDSPTQRQKLQQTRFADVGLHFSVDPIHWDKSFVPQADKQKAMTQTLAEWWILSRCTVVISTNSDFGMHAAFLNGSVPALFEISASTAD